MAFSYAAFLDPAATCRVFIIFYCKKKKDTEIYCILSRVCDILHFMIILFYIPFLPWSFNDVHHLEQHFSQP